MKVYVDELQKNCWDCPCHEGEHGNCQLLKKFTDYPPRECPLQSLADYTKQVRKEVCEEIRKQIDNYAEIVLSDYEKESIEYSNYDGIFNMVLEILDQIQGD